MVGNRHMNQPVIQPEFQPWQDPNLTPDGRAADLYARMTTAERLAQLGSCWAGNEVISGNVAPMQDVFTAGSEPLHEQSRNGLGHITRPFGTKPIPVADGVHQLIEYQRTVMANNRFAIPAIAHEECLTGFTAWGATVFPAAIAWGATWNPGLIHDMAAAIGATMQRVGVHQGLAPLLDVVRDYRWGRVEETIGEDPLLVGTLGSAYVQGLQSSGITATLKHFAGYSASRAGRNHAPVSMGPREFAEVILFPFEMAVRIGGTKSVMNSYSDVDGVPAAIDRTLLTTILRDRWGFDGTVVSDYWSIAFVKTMHRVASSYDDAGVFTLAAGLDVELPDTLAYGDALLDRITSGELDESLIEQSVLRVLRQKAELGLLDAGWDPAAGHDATSVTFDLNPAHNQALATRVADASVILLDNTLAFDGSHMLPLQPAAGTRIAVIGPVGHDPLAFMGCYSFPNHVLPHHPSFGLGIEAPSLLDALRTEFPLCAFDYCTGVPVKEADASGVADAVDAACAADVVLLAVGDRAGLFGMGTSGEGTDTSTLRLPGLQHTLAEAVLAANPNTVLIAITGRPYAIADFATHPVATVQAFMPGQAGGQAIAGVLSGRINPSGRLPVQIPRLDGPQPSTYLQARLGLHTEGVSNLNPTPAHAFGHGLSYTSFEVGNLWLDRTEIGTDDTLSATVTVRNTGTRSGVEVVQVYLTDYAAQTVRPVKRLIAFARVDIDAGSAVDVTFGLHADLTSLVGIDLTRIVEPGLFRLTAARSATDRGSAADFTVLGDAKPVSDRWTMTATVITRALD